MEYMGGEVYKTFRVFGKSLKKITGDAATDKVMEPAKIECG